MKSGTRIVIVLLLALFGTVFGAETLSKPSVVEAYGYSALEKGKSISEVYREALRDALQNAVAQAHTTFDIEARIEGMQLKNKTIRARSLGYVKNSRVMNAGFLPNDPLIYRIHITAVILPLKEDPEE